MAITYSEHLPKRVPEFLQHEDTHLYEYLEACGEVFDELSDTIKQHDVYKDYKRVPEARLSLLARRFAFNPPNNIPEELLRGIVRDIAGIYTTKGVENSLTWVFRLIGWSSTISYAWVLNPERYDPNVKDIYPELYERDGLENEASSLNSFFPSLGDGYTIGDTNQPFHDNPAFIVDGPLVIGRNFLISLVGEGNPYLSDLDRTSTDFDKIDYRNFVYGDVVDRSAGAFFDGRSYFSRRKDIRDAKIVGEIYREEDIIKFNPSVISTPYIVVKVDSEDYDKFTRPYVDEDGNFYSYTDREKFRVAQTIIEYLFFEFIRPANVRIIMVASAYEEADYLNMNDRLVANTTTPPEETTEVLPLMETEESWVGDPEFFIGSKELFVGMPSYIFDSGLMPLEAPKIGSEGKMGIQTISPEFTYEYVGVPMIETDVGSGLFDSEEVALIRTPSIVTVISSAPVAIYGKEVTSSDWEWIEDVSSGTHEFRVFDYTNIKLTNYTEDGTPISDGNFNVTIAVTWEDKQEVQNNAIEWDFGAPAIYPIEAS